PNSLEAPPLEEGELRPEASLKPMFHSNSLTTATKKPLALHCWIETDTFDILRKPCESQAWPVRSLSIV
ncbi:MAG: hypothetical protein ACLQPD_34305, partial [Desulfomonilaceae bacterium]